MVGARRRLRETVTVLLVLGLALSMLRKSARSPGALGPIDRGVVALVSPVQRLMVAASSAVVGFFAYTFDLDRARAEITILRRTNDELRAELLQARRAAEQSSRLERLIGLRDGTAEATIAARVISIDAAPGFRTARVVIDRGAADVRRGMPIITAAGIVGRVDAVAGGTASVQLAVDPQSSIDVFIPRTGGRGLLVGKADSNGFRCEVQYLARGTEPRPGDAVITSGTGGFPRDLPVGTVTAVRRKPAGLFQEVEVEPAVDLGRLAEVLVVVAPPVEREPESAKERALRPNRGVMPYP